MAGRENTESDLLDLSLRRLLYNGTTYSYECGGKTMDIRNLTNEGIRQYHGRHYDWGNVTVLLMGAGLEPEEVFEALEGHLPDISNASSAPGTATGSTVMDSSSKKRANLTTTDPIIFKPITEDASSQIVFPSSDEDVGSVTFAWQGPASEEFATILSLDVLMRYLTDTSASPLYQAFVERGEEAWATEVDYDVRGFVQVGMLLYFSGVPYVGAGSAEVVDGEGEGGESMMIDGVNEKLDVESMDEDPVTDDEDGEWSDEEDECETDDDLDDDDASSITGSEMSSAGPKRDLFVEGVFKEELRRVLKEIVDKGISTGEMTRTIERYRRKIQEALEDDPHEVIANYLVPDITRFYLAADSKLGDAKHGGAEAMNVGTRGEVFTILDDLLTKPSSFWNELLTKWVLDAPTVEVLTVPSTKLAAENAKKEADALQKRRLDLGEEGLAKKARIVKDAFEKNKVNIPKDILDAFPPVQDIGELPKLPCNVIMKPLPNADQKSRPFTQVQVVETETLFSFMRVAFNTNDIPDNLRPYLVLFQELLFQSPVSVVENGKVTGTIAYQNVIRQSSDLFVSHEAGVGFGNDLWSAGWLSEVMLLAASMEPHKMKDAVPMLVRILLFTEFTVDRIVSSLQKLVTDISEVKRDGGSVLTSVTTRMTSTQKSLKGAKIRNNDLEISIFKQETFLRELLKELRGNKKKAKQVIESLESLRTHLVCGRSSPGFMQVALPNNLSVSSDVILNEISSCWDKEFENFKALHKKVKHQNSNKQSPFPFPRDPYNLAEIDKTFTLGVLVPVQGISASYLSVIVPCDILRTKDFFAGKSNHLLSCSL
jgi:Zn-dependent M16 (insulinase) family peptidase